MWVSQTLLSLLLLMATSEGYYSELYPMPVGFMANDDTVSIPVREPKSGIFWTGRRYSRRGSSEETKKKVKTRAESRFVIGSRYGKRTDVVPLDFGSNLCKFTSFHPLYPCSNR
ncbi:uncharacterized protein LOC106664321 [Cimex lectularius]|uniref:RYamide n=1 Tax=Cimex lectularius TaxID=79782 RepID=A0A8I6RFU8_CIMLE|nr:uncharacterized protein LOC106664321 [Cimex lectularius]